MVLDTLHVLLLLQNLVQAAAVPVEDGQLACTPAGLLSRHSRFCEGLRMVPLDMSWIHLDFRLLGVREDFNVIGVNSEPIGNFRVVFEHLFES